MNHISEKRMHELFIHGYKIAQLKAQLKKIFQWVVFVGSLIAVFLLMVSFVVCMCASFYFFFKYWQVGVSILVTIAAFLLMLLSVRLIVKPGYEEFNNE